MDLVESFLALSEANRSRVYAATALLVAAIAWLDWRIVGFSLGFLYIIPILLASATLSGPRMLSLAAACGVLRELFGPAYGQPGAAWRIFIGVGAFAMAGFFVSELNRKRRLVTQHLQEREEQMRLRREAEREIRVLVNTSPLAILTLDGAGKILLANESVRQVLGLDERPLEGRDIQPYLPILNRFLTVQRSTPTFRTSVEGRGQRANGEVFLAQVWLSTFATASGPRLAAFVWDASENLRDREGTGLDSMMATSRVLIGAVCHEIRNLAAAALSAHRELASRSTVEQAQDVQALGAILEGVEKIAASGLRLAPERTTAVADLGMVLDETRVVVETSLRDLDGTLDWKVANGLPLVQADHHSLLQVFLNLARNSQRAIRRSESKVLTVEAGVENNLVMVRFRDTGPGISNPENLFRPFQPGAHSTGLGLYISRAVLRSHSGDLWYEPCNWGSCFAVQLWPAVETRERNGR